ncbi:hypothetical protein VIGAN_07039200, partial [Vigna angularis var. angularis]
LKILNCFYSSTVNQLTVSVSQFFFPITISLKISFFFSFLHHSFRLLPLKVSEGSLLTCCSPSSRYFPFVKGSLVTCCTLPLSKFF